MYVGLAKSTLMTFIIDRNNTDLRSVLEYTSENFSLNIRTSANDYDEGILIH